MDVLAFGCCSSVTHISGFQQDRAERVVVAGPDISNATDSN